MTMIAIERSFFEVVRLNTKPFRGVMTFNYEMQELLYDRYGLIVVGVDTKLRCKICRHEYDGYKVRSHTIENAHVNTWESKHSTIISQNILLGSWCDGCPCLMWENHPYLKKQEQVCRLGFCHEEEDALGIKYNHVIDDELWRPEMCKERSSR